VETNSQQNGTADESDTEATDIIQPPTDTIEYFFMQVYKAIEFDNETVSIIQQKAVQLRIDKTYTLWYLLLGNLYLPPGTENTFFTKIFELGAESDLYELYIFILELIKENRIQLQNE